MASELRADAARYRRTAEWLDELAKRAPAPPKPCDPPRSKQVMCRLLAHEREPVPVAVIATNPRLFPTVNGVAFVAGSAWQD